MGYKTALCACDRPTSRVMPPAENRSVFVTLTETQGRKLTLALSTPYRTSASLQCSVPVIPGANAVALARKVALHVAQQPSSLWADEDVEKEFWNLCHLRSTLPSSSEVEQQRQAIIRAVAGSKPCGRSPHAMDRVCFPALVLAQIGELKDALRFRRTDEIKRLGPNCKAHQEHAAWMLKHVQAWLRRQFVLRKLGLPNELDDACGRAVTQLSQWISALDAIVAAYEAWLADRAAARQSIVDIPAPKRGESKLWKFNKAQYRDLSSLIASGKERKADGDWATVYKGQLAHKNLKKPHEAVAIKIYKWDRTAGEHHLIHRRYREELEVRRTLVHPNILPLHGVATNLGHLPALVSPWCTPVKEYVIAQRNRAYANPPVISILLNLLEQLLGALKYIHNQSTVGCHGNLKGHNVMVARDGNLQICDFGVRFPRDYRVQLGTSYRLQERGSVPYLSPELIPTMRPTPKSDMWAASCVFVEMVTGHAPYYGKGSAEEVVKEISAHKPPANRRPGEVTEELWKLVTRNFERDPKKRLSAAPMLTRLWILRYQDRVLGEPIER